MGSMCTNFHEGLRSIKSEVKEVKVIHHYEGGGENKNGDYVTKEMLMEVLENLVKQINEKDDEVKLTPLFKIIK